MYANAGPQPPEAMISVVCEMFNVSPEEALLMDPKWVIPIAEYRLAEQAKSLINAKRANDVTEPMARLVREMKEAITEDE